MTKYDYIEEMRNKYGNLYTEIKKDIKDLREQQNIAILDDDTEMIAEYDSMISFAEGQYDVICSIMNELGNLPF